MKKILFLGLCLPLIALAENTGLVFPQENNEISWQNAVIVENSVQLESGEMLAVPNDVISSELLKKMENTVKVAVENGEVVALDGKVKKTTDNRSSWGIWVGILILGGVIGMLWKTYKKALK